MSEKIPTTCRACGCAGFREPPGCNACGFGSDRETETYARLPSPRDSQGRSDQIRAIVLYAVETKDVDSAVRALDVFVLPKGSPLAARLGAT